MGNSEVGHLNLGAGRVVEQSLTYVQNQIDSGAFFDNPVLNTVYDAAASSSGALHLMGLVSDGGVHSDLRHLVALLKLAARKGTAPVYVHVFTDGRDTPPQSGLGFVTELQAEIDALSGGTISRIAYGVGPLLRDGPRQPLGARTARLRRGGVRRGRVQLRAVRRKLWRMPTPVVKPTSSSGPPSLRAGPGLKTTATRWFFSISAPTAPANSPTRCSVTRPGNISSVAAFLKVHYASLMEYDAQLNVPYALAVPELKNSLAEVLSAAGKTQYHTAETEKYPHVTYFFDAKIEVPFRGRSAAAGRFAQGGDLRPPTRDERPGADRADAEAAA